MTTGINPADIRLEQLLDNALDGIFVLDRDRGYIVFNRACERLTGYSAADLIGRQCQCADIFDCQDKFGRPLSGILCPAKALLEGRADAARQRMQIQKKDGTPIWVETIYTAVRDRDRRVELVLGVVRDANETQAAEDELLGEMSKLRERVRSLSEDQKARFGFDNIISKSPAMVPVFQKIRAALRNSSPVLISGEAGTGKETIARTIHTHGLQSDGPFVPFNCAALPRLLVEPELFGYVKGAFPGAVQDYPGLLRSAEEGTVFLDELAEMPTDTQAKLLRALHDRRVRPIGSTAEVPIHIRVIAATDQDPAEAVRSRKLRPDLHDRLAMLDIALPPLRQRREDIPILVQAVIEQFNRSGLRHVGDVAPAAWRALLGYTWPGNIRELSNAVESALALGEGPVLRREDLPPDVQGLRAPRPTEDAAASLKLDPHLERVERDAIRRALQAANWQRNAAAQLMGISRSRLYRRMEALGIDPNDRG